MRFYHKGDQQMQVKNHSSRHRILAPISVLLILALAASLFSFAAVAGGESIYAKAADAAHHVLDVGRVAAHDHVAEVGDVDVDEVLALLHLGLAVNALVGLDAQADVVADDRAL